MPELTLTLDVLDCPQCRGDHRATRFAPGSGPRPGQTHWASCPLTGEVFWMDTGRNGGAWDGLLRAAGGAP